MRSVRYGAAYESTKFLGNAADAITMLGVGMVGILALDGLLPSVFGSPFHGQALVFMLLYLWSKSTPDTKVSLFGVVNFNAMYLPFALMAIDVMQGASPMVSITGILAGHVYYFLTEQFPALYGWYPVKTPRWLYVVGFLCSVQ